MTLAFQASLLDGPTLGLGSLDGVTRTHLGAGAWIDVLPGWVQGADELFAELVSAIPWRAEQRQMYDAVVDVPRLVHTYGVRDPLPHPLVESARESLSDYYFAELGERFVTTGCCLYRDGNDSVAWHGDNLGRSRTRDTMVAIVSLGSPRRLSLRPLGGATAASFPLGHGDLAVMGGSCQRTFQHAVLKTARPTGPRISLQFRPLNVW